MKLFTALTATTVVALVCADDLEDGQLSFSQICAENGYQFEQHIVVTEDGYILKVFRIPGKVNEVSQVKPTVLMQHGILDSAFCWVVNFADVAPAFVAVNAGYDVWLGNSRGNTFSRQHETLDPDKDAKKFWAFDWEQMGKYDLPAVIDHIQSRN